MKDTKRHRPYPEIFQEYHTMNTTLEGDFIKVGNKEVFRKPLFLKKNLIRTNQNKYYRCYKSKSHNIDGC